MDPIICQSPNGRRKLLSEMQRAALQKLAKELGIKANGKSADMIERILEAMPEREQCAVPPSTSVDNVQGNSGGSSRKRPRLSAALSSDPLNAKAQSPTAATEASAKVETSFTNALYQPEEPVLSDAIQSSGDMGAPDGLTETQILPTSGKGVPQSSPSQVSDDQEYLSPGEHSISSDSEADQEDVQRSNQDLVDALQPDNTGTEPKPSSEFASNAESDIPGLPKNEAGTTVDNAKTAEVLDAAAVEPSNLADTVTVAEPEEAHIDALAATAAAICLPPAQLDEHVRPEGQASPQSRGCENEDQGTAVGQDQAGPEELSKLEALLFDGNRAVSNAAVAAPTDGNHDEPMEQRSPLQATADALASPQKDSCSLESMQDGACRNPLFEEPKAGNGEQASGLSPAQKASNVQMLEADMSARERDAFERGRKSGIWLGMNHAKLDALQGHWSELKENRGWTLPSLEDVQEEGRILVESGFTTVNTPVLNKKTKHFIAEQQRKNLAPKNVHRSASKPQHQKKLHSPAVWMSPMRATQLARAETSQYHAKSSLAMTPGRSGCIDRTSSQKVEQKEHTPGVKSKYRANAQLDRAKKAEANFAARRAAALAKVRKM